jgi:hypothetical protein
MNKFLCHVGAICLLLGGSIPLPGHASDCCCCEEEPIGIWWSKGPGRRAFLLGGVIVLGGVTGILAGSQGGGSHHSKRYRSNNGGDQIDNEEGFAAVANAGANANNNAVTQGVNNLAGLPGFQVTGLGITQANDPIGIGGLTVTQAKALKSPRASSTLAKAKQIDQTMVVQFHVSLSDIRKPTILTPFVNCPDGNTITGSPVVAAIGTTTLSITPITIYNPVKGAYQMGINDAQSSLSHGNAHLQNIVTNSQDGSMRQMDSCSGCLMNEFVYDVK